MDPVACVDAVAAALAAETGAPDFTEKATVTRGADGKVKIRFAVDRETDVTVAIENAKGEIVRHLVAGRLGPNAPPPLTAHTLAQSLDWDGCDNDGRPVRSGRYRVRVGLGLTAAPAGFIGENRDPLADYDALCAELERFDPELAKRPQVVAMTKADLTEVRDAFELVRERFAKRGVPIHLVSAATGEGIPELKAELHELWSSTTAG